MMECKTPEMMEESDTITDYAKSAGTSSFSTSTIQGKFTTTIAGVGTVGRLMENSFALGATLKDQLMGFTGGASTAKVQLLLIGFLTPSTTCSSIPLTSPGNVPTDEEDDDRAACSNMIMTESGNLYVFNHGPTIPYDRYTFWPKDEPLKFWDSSDPWSWEGGYGTSECFDCTTTEKCIPVGSQVVEVNSIMMMRYSDYLAGFKQKTKESEEAWQKVVDLMRRFSARSPHSDCIEPLIDEIKYYWDARPEVWL